MKNNIPRKSLEKILLVNWSRFSAETIKINDSVLFAGMNGTGKSTILDAVLYALTGSKSFNKAADDSERTVHGYVRGDTKSNGSSRYLRSGRVVSYIALEFYSPIEETRFVTGVYMESPSEVQPVKSYWFICKDASIDDFNFFARNENKILPTVKADLCFRGEKIKSGFFMNQSIGVEQVLRSLGLRIFKVSDYANKLLKMMAIKPEKNIDAFIRQSVLRENPVKAIEQIREGKHHFDELKAVYDNLLKQKEMLEELEAANTEYEKARRNADIKKYISYYQKICSNKIQKRHKEEQIEKDEAKIKRLKSELDILEKKEKDALDELVETQKKYESHDFDGKIKDLEQKLDQLDREIGHAQEEIKTIEELQKSVTEILNNPSFGLMFDDDKTLQKLLSDNVNAEEKYNSVLTFRRQADNALDGFRQKKYSVEKELDNCKSELSTVSIEIKKLESKKKTFPHELESAKQKLQAKLCEQGISTEVRFLAELVSEITQPEWQRASECFMGYDRYSLIVEDKYVSAARDAYKALGLKKPRLVLSDKIKPADIEPCSLASLLVVPNCEGRKYINYRFNHIHLCGDMVELHEHSQGGITIDGYRATAHSMDKMNIDDVDFTLGQDAIRLELERKTKIKQQKENTLSELNSNLDMFSECITVLQKPDFRADKYYFEAIPKLKKLQEERKSTEEMWSKLQNDPSFIALSEAHQKAETAHKLARKNCLNCSKSIAKSESDIESAKKELTGYATNISAIQNQLKEYESKHLDIKSAAIEEYEKHISEHEDGIIYADNTIRKAESDCDGILKKLTGLQIRFCQTASIDIRNGAEFIGYFRDYRNELTNVKAEETKQKIEQTKKNLESAFVTNFVAQICENITNAEKEIDKISDELENLPFGNDIYRFSHEHNPDKAAFFRIAKRFTFGQDGQLTLLDNTDDSYENDINEFMDIILSDSGGEELEDYRSYLIYDMSIKNKKNKNESFDLSKKQGSASNGEKQTPFFIILAASLMQYYPKNTNCARLALVDEAFSTLSSERIEQMVKYFEQNGFQVLYAAPPDKIGPIGSYINSTISLVEKGRYTKVVEGLVDDLLDKSE